MQESWMAISATRARAHPLYGVRGWLIALLWLNTLPALAYVQAMAAIIAMRSLSGTSLLVLTWFALPLVLTAVAFMRVRWFPVLWFVVCLLQLPAPLITLFGMGQWVGRTGVGLPIVLLVQQVLIPIVTMVYIVRSRRMRVTYRHQVRASDPATVPAVFGKPSRNETPTDATDHARERAALRRVTQELSSGVLDTQTWMQVMRHHAAGTDSARTAAYVRARMAVLCPPAHVHPPLWRTLAMGVGALLVSLLVAALLAGAMTALAQRLPAGDATRLGMVIAATPMLALSWLAGLFAGAGVSRRIP
jgi:hypothetical protein